MVDRIVNSIRNNTSRQMSNLKQDLNRLSGSMASGKKNITDNTSLELIQKGLYLTQTTVLKGASSAAGIAKTNINLAINALNAMSDIFNNALELANAAALDPTANFTQIGAEYTTLIGAGGAFAPANAYIGKISSTTKSVSGGTIFGAAVNVQVSSSAGDIITVTPTFDVLSGGNVTTAIYGGTVPANITDAVTGAAEVIKMKAAISAVAAQIATLNDFQSMLNSKLDQMGEQIDSATDGLDNIVSTNLPEASTEVNRLITSAAMIGAVLNADATLQSTINDTAVRIINRA